MKARVFKWVGRLLGLAVVAATAWLFAAEYQKNYAALSAANLRLHPLPLVGAVLFTLAGYLLTTWAWAYALNQMHDGPKLGLGASIPVVNLPSLTKYLPGKVWTFAIQAWWLGARGVSRPLVFFNGLLAIFLSLDVAFCLGAVYWWVHPHLLPAAVRWPVTLGLLAVEVALLAFTAKVLAGAGRLLARLLKREVVTFTVSARALLVLQAMYALIFLLFGVGAGMAALGVGLELPAEAWPDVIASNAVADALGYLVLVVPGGFGVREGVMYAQLKATTNEQLALVLPLAVRVVMMSCELMLGLVALALVRRHGPTPATPAS